MVAFTTTSTLLSVVLLWQCTLYTVEPRPLFSKKYTASSSKHHHRTTSHKNAVEHPQSPASLRQLAIGSHKSAREILPYGLSPSNHQASKGLQDSMWGAFKPALNTETGADGFGGARRVETAIAAESSPKTGDDAFEIWGAFKPAPHTGTGGGDVDFSTSGVPASGSSPEISDMWGDYVPVAHTGTGGDGFRSTDRAEHAVPGSSPRTTDDAFGSQGFGAFAFNEEQADEEELSDGWFMSVVPYPQDALEQAETESSSDAFADMWSLFREIRNGCDDNLNGLPCMSNGDCHGCNRTFVCSTKSRCEKV